MPLRPYTIRAAPTKLLAFAVAGRSPAWLAA
jgi:hypothetical protein